MTTLVKHSNGAVTMATNGHVIYLGAEEVAAVDVTELPREEQLELLHKPDEVFPDERDKAYKKETVRHVQ